MAKVTITGPRTKDNVTQFLGINVYEAAKVRIRELIVSFDTLAVAFSGGKDSLAVLHLVKEVYDEMGIKEPVKVVFRDEELIPDEVIDFVNEYRQKPWIDMKWFCVPLKSQKFILGKSYDYVQWDPNRSHLRPQPEWGIKDNTTVYDQYTMDDRVAKDFKGKVCILTGVRADESMVRLQSVLNKINKPHVVATKSNRVMLGRPIYDWKENDVFKYFFEKKIQYCKLYDYQMMNGEALRVSTPLHAEFAKRLGILRTRSPKFYEQLIGLFPEMVVQEKYYEDVDRFAVMKHYKVTADGIYHYILDNIEDPIQQKLALKRLTSAIESHKKMPGSYPLDHIFKVFISGSYKRAHAFFKKDENR